MYIEKLASQIKNDVVSGLRGYHLNLSMNIDLLQDEIVACRLAILHDYFLKGIFPLKDLFMAINCVEVDCESLERCKCREVTKDSTMVRHFLIPQIITLYGKKAIDYIGSTDRMYKFNIITSLTELETRKYKKRGSDKPYVWIDLAPNVNGMLDCFLFNAPFVNEISVVAAFKDPRDLKQYSCCQTEELKGQDTNDSFIDLLIKDKLTKEKIYYYRLLRGALLPNDQQYTTGG